MLNYVGLLWNSDDIHDSTLARQMRERLQGSSASWTCSFDAQGCSVMSLNAQGRARGIYPLPHESGVILGRLFPINMDNWCSTWRAEINEQACADFVVTAGRALMEQYWGSYIAFLRDPHGDRKCVLRDSSGSIPCYRVRHRNIEIIFSDIGDLAPLGLPKFTIDTQYVASFIYSSQLQVRRTGFAEVSEILAGEGIDIRVGRLTQQSLWDPRLICRGPTIDDYDEAVSAVRRSTQLSVDAWASTVDNVILHLSGGFDSAVVLGCLTKATASPTIVCLNRYSERPGEDERSFARLAAASAKVALLEHPWTPELSLFDRDVRSVARAVKPSMSTLVARSDIDIFDQLASKHRVDAVWTGEGGDHLFYQMKTSLGAADYFSRRRLSKGFYAAVTDSAQLSGKSLWTTMTQAIKLGGSTAKWRPDIAMDLKPLFVQPDALPVRVEDYVAHPWTEDSGDIPKGKQYQIYLLAEVLHRNRPDPRLTYADEQYPLLSQPLIETCLRVPTYLLQRGGRQRALAREAFQDHVPAEIIAREQKGATTQTIFDEIRRSEDFLQELLLDGLLVKEHVIDCDALEPFLVQGKPLRVEHLYPLLACIAGELWIRSWSTSDTSDTAAFFELAAS